MSTNRDKALGFAAAVVLVGLIVILAIQFGGQQHEAPGPSGASASQRTPKAGAPDASLADASSSRVRVAVERGVDVAVRDSLGGPLVAHINAVDGGSFVAQDLTAVNALEVTDDSGLGFVSESRLAGRSQLIVWAQGYVPKLLPDVHIGQSYDVQLAVSERCTVHVRTNGGTPVDGFSVAVSAVDLSDVSLGASMGALFRVVGDEQVVAGVGASANGEIVIEGLAPGRHLLHCNLSGLPYIISNWADCLYVDAPGEASVIVSPIVGAAIQFAGDEVVMVGQTPLQESPFTFFSDLPSVRALRSEKARLTTSVPGSHVICGAVQPGRKPEIKVYVFGRRSGWTEHVVRLRDVRGIEEPVRIDLHPGSGDGTAEVAVHLKRDGESISYEGAQVAFVWVRDGVSYYKQVPIGEVARIPPGDYRMSAAGLLPPDAFPMQSGSVSVGDKVDLNIDLDQEFYRYAIEVELPDGSRPNQCGLVFSWNASGTRQEVGAARRSSSSMSVDGGRYEFLCPNKRQGFRVFVRGFQGVAGIVEHMEGHDDGSAEVFKVVMKDLAR